jgi:hypothetical protein
MSPSRTSEIVRESCPVAGAAAKGSPQKKVDSASFDRNEAGSIEAAGAFALLIKLRLCVGVNVVNQINIDLAVTRRNTMSETLGGFESVGGLCFFRAQPFHTQLVESQVTK